MRITKLYYVPEGKAIYPSSVDALLLTLADQLSITTVVRSAYHKGWYWRGIAFVFLRARQSFMKIIESGAGWDMLRSHGLDHVQRISWSQARFGLLFTGRATVELPRLPYSELQAYYTEQDLLVMLPLLFKEVKLEFYTEETWNVPFWKKAPVKRSGRSDT
jgi:hypothetical protein